MNSERVVLITGCTSGFGRAMAPLFAGRGWQVLAGARGSDERLADLQASLRQKAPGVDVIPLDLNDSGHRDLALQNCADRFGRLDCLVNNAGEAIFGPFEEASEQEIRGLLETNIVGTMLLTKALLPLLRASGGRIINISSVFGFSGFPMMSLYCASKFALEGWSESLGLELRPHGVQVALVEPGGFRTRFSENAKWPATSLDAYAGQRKKMRSLRARLASRRAVGPETVAERVVALAGARHMPVRTRVGRDSVLTWLSRHVLPERIGWRLFARGIEHVLERS